MNYLEEKKAIINGIPCQYLSHVQNVTQAGNVFPAHFHNYIELIYNLIGEYEVYLNGKHHVIKEKDFVLINSKEVHQINALSKDGGKYIVLRFEPEVIYNGMSQNLYEIKYVLPFVLENFNHEKVICNKHIDTSFILELLQDILRELDNNEYGFELAIKNNIGRIFLWVIRYWHNVGAEINVGLDEDFIKKMQPAFDYVLKYYNEDVIAVEAAKLCNMSYSYFSRKFNQLMRISFSDYVNYVRVMEAEKLLVSTDLNITEISNKVGFNTTSYFIKIFKQLKNSSPKQYKKQIL